MRHGPTASTPSGCSSARHRGSPTAWSSTALIYTVFGDLTRLLVLGLLHLPFGLLLGCLLSSLQGCIALAYYRHFTSHMLVLVDTRPPPWVMTTDR